MLKVLPVPESDWVERLRKGNYVWLVKEKEYACVAWEYEPPEPGKRTGRIAIDRYDTVHGFLHYKGQQTWYVGNRGQGIDGTQLFAPCEDNLPEDPVPLPEVPERQIRRTLADLEERVRRLEGSKLFQFIRDVAPPAV